jgi:hypothetical protein
MRRIQISASGAGECAVHSALGKTGDSVAAWLSTTSATVGGYVAMFCSSEADLANGCTGGAVRFWDVSQQVLFAQHPDSHALSLRTFDRIQVVAGSRTAASKSAVASIIDMLVLLVITLFLARSAPFVEKCRIGEMFPSFDHGADGCRVSTGG